MNPSSAVDTKFICKYIQEALELRYSKSFVFVFLMCILLMLILYSQFELLPLDY